MSRYWYGAGKVKFYLDGYQECGTGAEVFFSGARSFVRYANDNPVHEQTYSTPFMGFPHFQVTDNTRPHIYNGATCPMRGFYRWHILDSILFEEDYVCQRTVRACSASTIN
ncbi:DUF2961 domain-containing protein [Paenibacillus sp. CR_12]|uniref:DUF2961 domain-containing protein n=1 Tax=Paenibacillus sp. CR_12 TaxID=3055793 RepID=UPI0035C0BCBF